MNRALSSFIIIILMASHAALGGADTVRSVIERYGAKLDVVTCEEEPPGKIRSCQFASRGKTIRLHLRYDAKLLFSPAEGWTESKILDAQVLQIEEDNR